MNGSIAKKLQIILGTILLALLLTMPAAAAENGKTVRVACGMNDALYLDENGDPDGIGLAYLRQLAWNNNWTLEYIEGSYNESLQKLENGEIDLMFPVGATENPDGKFAYSDFIGGYQQIGLFAREDADIYYNDYTGFDGKRVALSIGSNSDILDDYAAEHGFDYQKVALNTTQDKIEALTEGTVDLIAFSTLNYVPGGKLVAVLEQLPFYFCTSSQNQELLAELNDGMSTMLVNTPNLASKLYQEMVTGRNEISYTSAEHDKIQSSDTVIIGVYGNRLPLAGVDEKGRSIGIYVDFLNAIAQQSGLKIKAVPISDDNRLYSAIDDGSVDFVVGLQELRFSQENAENHLSSNHITDCNVEVITQQSCLLKAKKAPKFILTQDRTYLENTIFGWFPHAEIAYVDTRRECLDAVCDGKADATMLDAWEYSYESKNARFDTLMTWDSFQLLTGPTLGGSRQSDLELLSILEKTISKIPAATITDITTANLNRPYTDYTPGDKLYAARWGIVFGGIFALAALISLIFYTKTKYDYIRRLEVANQTKSDFLSRMSHELRTPLNAINGYVALTARITERDEINKEELLDNMDAIHRSSDYLLGIINDVLDVRRMETGQLSLNPVETDLADCLRSVTAAVKPAAEEKGVNYAVEVRGASYKIFRLDALRVQQILLRLCNNGVKFTPAGGRVTLNVAAKVKDSDDVTLTFTVSDTGIGMSREFMETKLYHVFAQENQDITSPYAGCGTGLALCKQLVELMGGEISCESEQGRGTTFAVTLQTTYRRAPRVSKTRNILPPDLLAGVRVLMCEDNPVNQEIEKRMLEKIGCVVDAANNGKIGCTLFEASTEGYYQVILMDIRMPEMDGLEATRNIRAMQRGDAKSVPIFAVSANAFEEDVQKSLAAGMNEHLSKPMDIHLIAQKIKDVCHKTE